MVMGLLPKTIALKNFVGNGRIFAECILIFTSICYNSLVSYSWDLFMKRILRRERLSLWQTKYRSPILVLRQR